MIWLAHFLTPPQVREFSLAVKVSRVEGLASLLPTAHASPSHPFELEFGVLGRKIGVVKFLNLVELEERVARQLQFPTIIYTLAPSGLASTGVEVRLLHGATVLAMGIRKLPILQGLAKSTASTHWGEVILQPGAAPLLAPDLLDYTDTNQPHLKLGTNQPHLKLGTEARPDGGPDPGGVPAEDP